VWTLQFLVSLVNDGRAFAATTASRPAGMDCMKEGELGVSRLRRGLGMGSIIGANKGTNVAQFNSSRE